MKKLVKKIFSVGLALYMAASLLPLAALAEAPNCGLNEHEHSDACKQQTLICTQEHEHSGDCSETELICTLDEHSHSDNCYKTADKNTGPDESENTELADDGTYDEAALIALLEQTKTFINKYLPDAELDAIRSTVAGFDREKIASIEAESAAITAQADALGASGRAAYYKDGMSAYLPPIAAGISDAKAKFAEEDARPKPVPVASVGGKGYLSLDEALSAASLNGEVKLTGNVTLNAAVEIKRNVTLDLNGFGISGEGGLLTVNEALLNIKNGTLSASGEAAAIKLTDCILNVMDVDMSLSTAGIDANGTCIVNIFDSSDKADATKISTVSFSGNSASMLNIYGGRIEAVNADCTVNISGGSIGTLTIGERGRARITGGSFSQDVSRYVPTGYVAKLDGDIYSVESGAAEEPKPDDSDSKIVEETVAAAVKAAEAENSTVDITLPAIESGSADITAYVKTIADSGAALSLTVPVSAGKVTFDKNALKAISDKADADISLSVATLTSEAIPEEVGLSEDAVVIEINLSGADVSEAEGGFGSGSATVTVAAPENISSPAVYYINGNDATPVDCTLNEDGTISFTITHFSRYAIMNAPAMPATVSLIGGSTSDDETDTDDKTDAENKTNAENKTDAGNKTDTGAKTETEVRNTSRTNRPGRTYISEEELIEAELDDIPARALFVNEVHCKEVPAEDQIRRSSFYEKPEDLDSEHTLTSLSSKNGMTAPAAKTASRETDNSTRIGALIVMSLSAACLVVGAMLYFAKRRNCT